MTPARYRAAVVAVVRAIPPGRVMAYGAIARYLAEASGRASPRLVGQIMARGHEPVPWHRVVREDGQPARGHEARALRLLLDDGTPIRGTRVDMAAAAWRPEQPASALLASALLPARTETPTGPGGSADPARGHPTEAGAAGGIAYTPESGPT